MSYFGLTLNRESKLVTSVLLTPFTQVRNSVAYENINDCLGVVLAD